MSNHDELIKKVLINGKGIITERFNQLNKYPYIIKYLQNRFHDSTDIREVLLRLKKGALEEKPLCPCCGKPVKFIGKPSKMFQKYCSNSCRSKMINKYIWINGQQQYNLEHYGVKYNVETDQFKQKRKDTLFDRYGNENFNNIEKRKETCIEKYNDANYNNQDKRYETMLQNYNSQWVSSDIGKSTLSKILSSDEVNNKKYATHKKNKSFNMSKSEDECYTLLKEKYPDVIRQYRDKNRYPFNCDFYIPSLDLFIEFQGSQYHHGKPYNGTVEDIIEVEIIKEKLKNNKRHLEGKKSQWDNILYTWTDLDVRKRQTANDNNLNYLEFFNINEFLSWYDKL